MAEVRPFVRHDREQLTRLVNAHIAAAAPGRLPSGGHPSAAAGAPGRRVRRRPVGHRPGDAGRRRSRSSGSRRPPAPVRRRRPPHGELPQRGEIVWLVCWPEQLEAGRAVRDAALAQIARWGVARCYGDGSLPVPCVYRISDVRPDVRRLVEEAGFDAGDGQVEVVVAGPIEGLAEPGPPPVPGLELRRQLGPLGTEFDAVLHGDVVGVFEVDDDLTRWARRTWPSPGGPTSATTGSATTSGVEASGPGSSATPAHGCASAAPIVLSPT